MPEEGQRRFPKWFPWVVIPVDVLGLYLAAFAAAPVLGIALLAGGAALSWYLTLARKPA